MQDRERAGVKRDMMLEFDVPDTVVDFPSFLAWFKSVVYADMTHNNDVEDGGAPIPGSAYKVDNILPPEVAQRLELPGDDPQIKDAIDIDPDVKARADEIMSNFNPDDYV